ncbi:prostate stem cell antigen-like [Arapaima gigas]
MASALFALLRFLLLCTIISSAQGLTCYVCSSTTSNSDCNKNTAPCVTPLDTCMTTVDTQGGSKAIVKLCASAATCAGAVSAAHLDASGNGNTVSCCSSQLCNVNGAGAARLHAVLLAVSPLGLLTVLRYTGT